MRLAILLLTAFFLSGCGRPVDRPAGQFGALAKIDAAQPFRIEFGRGSGMHGLETVALNSDGEVTLFREGFEQRGKYQRQYWETTTLKLAMESVAEALAEVAASGVLNLDPMYRADVADGTQWVFWARQGDNEKVVYFDNNFPKAITRFAEARDAILAKNGIENAHWQRVPAANSGEHDRELWASIKRRR